MGVILPPAPSFLQEGSSDACIYTRGSVRRASGFVLTGKPEGTTPEEAKSFELFSQACVLKAEQTPGIFPLRSQY
jgi:hypothetical protein